MDAQPPRLTRAPQPDLLRAFQKDQLYEQQLISSCEDVVRRLFGPVVALRFSREVRLLAHVLYHSLTTGTGQQTPGEEYCEIMQVTGSGRPPALPRRTALIALQTLLPYFTERLASRHDNMAVQWEPEQPSTSYASTASSHGSTASSYGSTASSARGGGMGPSPGACRNNGSGGRGAGGVWSGWLRRRWRESAEWIIAHWPQIRGGLSFLSRLHLGLFYCWGAYYHWAKRFTSVTYHSTRPPARPMSYQLLGVLLVSQLAVSALRPWLRTWSGAGSAAERVRAALVLGDDEELDSDNTDTGKRVCATPLSGRPVASQGGVTVAVTPQGVRPPPKPCPLCLSPRTHPTCTPCGHIFCWRCVTQWCGEKPECPLCRSSVLPTELVCLHNFNP